MKITLELDNLEGIVTNILSENLKSVIQQEVDQIIKSKVQESKENIDVIISDKIAEFTNEYIKTTQISIGGGWNKEPEVYTIEQYIQKEINDRIESGKILIKDSYHSDKYQSISDYIEHRFDMDKLITDKINKFTEALKKDINSKISDIFNQSTQAALSGSILNVLMHNDTYINMQNSIKRIANGVE